MFQTVDTYLPGVALGDVDMQQSAAWKQMTPAQRLDLAFQAYQFAMGTVRLIERQRSHGLTPAQMAWRVTRRIQGDQRLSREYHDVSATK
jgi:hypothetical protein